MAPLHTTAFSIGLPVSAFSSQLGGRLVTRAKPSFQAAAKTNKRVIRTAVPSCVADDAKDEEAVLNEAAMRAAEIHEVLKGLEDFKARIVDGAYRSRRHRETLSAKACYGLRFLFSS